MEKAWKKIMSQVVSSCLVEMLKLKVKYGKAVRIRHIPLPINANHLHLYCLNLKEKTVTYFKRIRFESVWGIRFLYQGNIEAVHLSFERLLLQRMSGKKWDKVKMFTIYGKLGFTRKKLPDFSKHVREKYLMEVNAFCSY